MTVDDLITVLRRVDDEMPDLYVEGCDGGELDEEDLLLAFGADGQPLSVRIPFRSAQQSPEVAAGEERPLHRFLLEGH